MLHLIILGYEITYFVKHETKGKQCNREYDVISMLLFPIDKIFFEFGQNFQQIIGTSMGTNSQYFCPIYLIKFLWIIRFYYQNNNEIFLLKTAKFSNFKDKQPFVKKKIHIDSFNDCKIIGCRKNILSIFVALLTFYNKEKRRKYHILKCQH